MNSPNHFCRAVERLIAQVKLLLCIDGLLWTDHSNRWQFSFLINFARDGPGQAFYRPLIVCVVIHLDDGVQIDNLTSIVSDWGIFLRLSIRFKLCLFFVSNSLLHTDKFIHTIEESLNLR